jgi:hypothetical protein
MVYPVPGPEFGPGVGTVLPPGPVTPVHTYPPPGSPTRTGASLSYSPEREGEPLPHPYPPPTQYPLPEQVQVPPGRTPSGRTRPSRAPTIVEVTGPEPIQVLPPGRPRTESARKYCVYMQRF